ncbi:MAG: hypothetical protein H5T69_21250, partial [Chloroflexi bacterium]|nr:hypothetical protein [Chloroflexota bacterium]
ATTDENGRFKLRVPKLEGELVVNAYGYEPLSVAVEKNPVISLVPLPEKVAEYWFNYWKNGDYERMFELLTNDCRNSITKEAFAEEFSRYKLEIVAVRTQRTGGEGDSAEVKAEVDINTPFGKQTLHFTIPLKKDSGIWKVVWYSGGTGMATQQYLVE